MDEKDLQEFDLEDIIREFSDEPREPEEMQDEQPAEQPEEVYTEEDLKEEPAAEETIPEETQPAPATVTSDTIRLDKMPEALGKVRNAVQINDEEEAMAEIPAEPEEKTEPFSEEWEPEYDQPIAEYVPARPIAFRPKSRLRELKRQLVAGPEKQYYLLSEQGVGRLQLAMLCCALVALASAVASGLFAFGILGEERLRLMVFGQFLAMLLSALLGCYQLLEGGADLLKGKFTLNTLLLFTFGICLADGILCLYQVRVPCCAAFSLQMTMSLWSAYHKRSIKLGQLDTMRKATRLDSLLAVEDYLDDAKGFLRGTGQVSDFMDTYGDTNPKEKILSIYGLVVLGFSVATGVVGGVLHGVTFGVQVAAVTTLAAVPASMFVIFSRPLAVLERRLHAVGTVLCGWAGIRALTGKNTVFAVDHNDLFPVGYVRMNGVKFFGSRQPDQIIAYTAALITRDAGTLEPLFTQLLESRNGMHYDAENFQRYENGVGGEVAGEPVLVGTRTFLKDMGVEVPEGLRINQAVCVAVDGEFCGLYALTYEKNRSSAAGISTLCGYRGLKPVLVTDDMMLTGEFLHDCFGISAKKLVTPEPETVAQLRQVQPSEDAQAAALITGEGLAPFAYAVTGARSLKTAINLGVAVHLAGGILGMLIVLLLAILGAAEQINPVNMFLYELVWMIPGILITQFTASL